MVASLHDLIRPLLFVFSDLKSRVSEYAKGEKKSGLILN
jgi:hypothetical protein